MTERWTDGVADLRCGRWQDSLADVERVDAVIVDPPYCQRTEDGFRTSRDIAARGMGYEPINEAWARAFVDAWEPRCRSWFVVCGSHESIRWFADALSEAGRYVFPPVVIVKLGAAPRLSCDGPASQAEYMTVARPRERRFMRWGSLPGWYHAHTVRHGHGSIGVSGAKHIDLMRALVRDYTRPGDLVCDPCAGGATTLRAAQLEGRRAVGAEMDPDTYAKAVARLAAPYTPALRMDAPKAVQGAQVLVEEGRPCD